VPPLAQAAPWLSRFSPAFVDAIDIELLCLYASQLNLLVAMGSQAYLGLDFALTAESIQYFAIFAVSSICPFHACRVAHELLHSIFLSSSQLSALTGNQFEAILELV
jgi:hypothetical protein